MKTEYPTEAARLLADLASWKNSAVSRDRKIDALHSLAGRAHDLIQPAPGLPEPIPAGIYWDSGTWCFYDLKDNLPPLGFREKWIARKDEFPKSAEEARNAQVAAITGDQELADRLAPKPGLVPLGVNRTEDGRPARVICTDSAKPGYPVVAEVRDTGGEWVLYYCTVTGESRAQHAGSRLIGHLPPEPPKPRERWIADAHGIGETGISIEKPVDAEERGFKLFREVLPE